MGEQLLTKNFGGIIEKWEIYRHKILRVAVFFGTVVEGSQKFADGHRIRSSAIMGIKQVDGRYVVETMNSFYHLVGTRGIERDKNHEDQPEQSK